MVLLGAVQNVLVDTLTKMSENVLYLYSCISEHSKHFSPKTYISLPPALLGDMSAQDVYFFPQSNVRQQYRQIYVFFVCFCTIYMFLSSKASESVLPSSTSIQPLTGSIQFWFLSCIYFFSIQINSNIWFVNTDIFLSKRKTIFIN